MTDKVTYMAYTVVTELDSNSASDSSSLPIPLYVYWFWFCSAFSSPVTFDVSVTSSYLSTFIAQPKHKFRC